MSSADAAPASLVIPAYREEAVIAKCLRAVLAEPLAATPQIVVVVNGSSDRTAQIARSFPGVTVLDLPEPGKAGALNAGDALAAGFPRIYLDADIDLSVGALGELISALDLPEPRVAAPGVRFDTSTSSRPVRAYYRVFRELPYATSGLVGLGVYGVSATGRARFGAFPKVLGDDLFVQRLFAPEERITTSGTFTVRAPRDLRSLLGVRTRVARGNAEVSAMPHAPHGTDLDARPANGAGTESFEASTPATLRALAGLVRRRPSLLPAAAVYCAVTAAARALARRAPSPAAGPRWERDDSTRFDTLDTLDAGSGEATPDASGRGPTGAASQAAGRSRTR